MYLFSHHCACSFPLVGRAYSNIFIHFEPIGKPVDSKDENAQEHGDGSHEHGNNHRDPELLPSYIIAGSVEAEIWWEEHPNGHSEEDDDGTGSGIDSREDVVATTGATNAHGFAGVNNVEALEQAIQQDEGVVHAKDGNGWTPLHEAAAGGHLESVQLLLDHGADVNAKSHDEGTALYWAKRHHEADHPVIHLLEEMGALEVGPEL
jgi:prolyl 4-hydroxylase